MNNIKKLVAVSGVAAALLSASIPAFALGDFFQDWKAPRRGDRPARVAAPEIDVSAGTKGIAVLIAGLFLAAEGLRRRR